MATWYNNFNIKGTIQISQLPVVNMVATSTGSLTCSGAVVVPVTPALDFANNVVSGKFVAPVNGIYSTRFGGNISALPAGTYPGFLQLCKTANSNVLAATSSDASITTNTMSASASHIVQLQAGDSLYLVGSNAVVYATPKAHLNVHLLTSTATVMEEPEDAI